jgi:Skp family chaperone for outer membrane proteins
VTTPAVSDVGSRKCTSDDGSNGGLISTNASKLDGDVDVSVNVHSNELPTPKYEMDWGTTGLQREGASTVNRRPGLSVLPTPPLESDGNASRILGTGRDSTPTAAAVVNERAGSESAEPAVGSVESQRDVDNNKLASVSRTSLDSVSSASTMTTMSSASSQKTVRGPAMSPWNFGGMWFGHKKTTKRKIEKKLAQVEKKIKRAQKKYDRTMDRAQRKLERKRTQADKDKYHQKIHQHMAYFQMKLEWMREIYSSLRALYEGYFSDQAISEAAQECNGQRGSSVTGADDSNALGSFLPPWARGWQPPFWARQPGQVPFGWDPRVRAKEWLTTPAEETQQEDSKHSQGNWGMNAESSERGPHGRHHGHHHAHNRSALPEVPPDPTMAGYSHAADPRERVEGWLYMKSTHDDVGVDDDSICPEDSATRRNSITSSAMTPEDPEDSLSRALDELNAVLDCPSLITDEEFSYVTGTATSAQTMEDSTTGSDEVSLGMSHLRVSTVTTPGVSASESNSTL